MENAESGESTRSTVEQNIQELTGRAEPARRSPREWKEVYTGIVEKLLSLSSWPGVKGSPRLLLDDIAHRALAPGAEVRREALSRALLEKVERSVNLNDRMFLLREVELVGSREVVPGLEKLYRTAMEPLRGYALRALDANPSGEAGTALLGALERSGGAGERVAIINALGRRRESRATGLIEKYLAGDDEDVNGVTAAALAALGNIGGSRAAGALATAREKVSGKLRPEVETASLLCADRLLEAGEKEAARKIFREIHSSAREDHIRLAARRGLDRSG